MTGAARLGYRPALDGIRGIAIVGVLLAHGFPGVMDGGGEGVTVFFVLSGYLITTLLMEEHASTAGVALGAFYVRRAGRLLPGLAAVLTGTAALLLAEGADAHTVLVIVGVGASYVSNLIFGTFDQQLGLLAIVGWTWTLSIEEQFYVFWPFALRRLLRCRRPLLAVGAVAGGLALISSVWFVILTVEGGHGMRAGLGTDTRSGALLMGCALAAYLRSGRLVRSWTAAPALFGLLVVYLIPLRSWAGLGTVEILFVPVASLFVIGVAAHDPKGVTRRILHNRAIVYLGTLSYGVYLWNSLLQWSFFGVGVSPRGVMVLAWIPLTILVAAASARFVERPCREWSRRYTRRRSTRSSPHVALSIAS